MIKVSYKIENEKVTYLKVTGHANYAEHGSDIVCSAVSSVVVGGLANLSSEDRFKILVREGNVEIASLVELNEHDSVVLETILMQLKRIEDSYSKYIRITQCDWWKEREIWY